MLKKWPLALAVLLIVCLSIWFFGNRSNRDAAKTESADMGLTLSYETRVVVRQRVEGQGEATVIDIQGQLDQAWDKGTDYLSRWAIVNDFVLMNKEQDAPTKESLANQSIHSHYMQTDHAFAHDFQDEFPKEFIPFHASLLHRTLLPISLDELRRVGTLAAKERDEVGEYEVIYTLAGDKVIKQWTRYLQDAIKVDRNENKFVYLFGSDGRLDSVSGNLTLHYRQSTPTRFHISIEMKRIGPSKAVMAQVDAAKAVRYSEADIAKGVSSASQSVISFEESFRLVDSITENSDSAEAFRIFTSLKNALNIDPSKAKDVIDKINSIKDRDPSSRRRLSVLFGALAQAKDPGISNLLADQAETCPDNFCKIQAIAGVNSHPNPTSDALDKMLDISQKSSDVEIAGNALLAAGSAGSRMDTPVSELSDTLIKTVNDPQKIAIKAAAIAAMGNHGSTDYLPVLQKNLNDPSSTNRSAAAYSMRYIPDPTVDKTLIGILTTEKDQTVLRDTLKALDYRSLSAEDYATISKKTLAISDPETQKIGARILVQAYREDPSLVESSLSAMADAASDVDVKAYIEGEMQKIKADRAAVAKPEVGE